MGEIKCPRNKFGDRNEFGFDDGNTLGYVSIVLWSSSFFKASMSDQMAQKLRRANITERLRVFCETDKEIQSILREEKERRFGR